MNRVVLHAIEHVHMHLPLIMQGGICAVSAVVASVLLLSFWDKPVRKWLMDRVQKNDDGLKAKS